LASLRVERVCPARDRLRVITSGSKVEAVRALGHTLARDIVFHLEHPRPGSRDRLARLERECPLNGATGSAATRWAPRQKGFARRPARIWLTHRCTRSILHRKQRRRPTGFRSGAEVNGEIQIVPNQHRNRERLCVDEARALHELAACPGPACSETACTDPTRSRPTRAAGPSNVATASFVTELFLSMRPSPTAGKGNHDSKDEQAS